MKFTILVLVLILIALGLLSFLKKSTAEKKSAAPVNQTVIKPYKDEASNLIYNLLFCDDLELFKKNVTNPSTYPYDILFAGNSSEASLQKIVDDPAIDPRIKVLACNKLRTRGHLPNKKELFAVIVEMGLDNGTDVLASFNNGTARYINQTGKILVWETTTNEAANKLTNALFQSSRTIVDKIGPWEKPRRSQPSKGMVRISFLVSDGLYFGEGPADVLFANPMAGPALTKATELMMFLMKN